MSSEKYMPTYSLCKKCGKVFEQYRSYHIYHNIECRELVYKRRYKYKKNKVKTKKCLQCNGPFESSDGKKKYCSDACYELHRELFYKGVDTHEVTCICGKIFITSHAAKKYHSPECSKIARDIRNRERSLKEFKG